MLRIQELWRTVAMADRLSSRHSGQNVFHPLMKEGLPTCELVTSLASLATFLKAHRPVEEPAPEEIEKALERDKKEKVEEKVESEDLHSTSNILFGLADAFSGLVQTAGRHARPSRRNGMITAIKEINDQTVVIELSGGYSDASFLKTMLKELGEVSEPTTFPDGYRVQVKGTKGNDLRCWRVRDRLAHEQDIVIHDDVNSYVERKKNRQE